MERQQESQKKASRKHSSSKSRKHPVLEEGETGGDRRHPHVKAHFKSYYFLKGWLCSRREVYSTSSKQRYAYQNVDGCKLPTDRDVSIEAIAKSWAESEHYFDFLNDALLDFRTPPVQPPPSAAVMPSASDTISCWKSMCDDHTTASTSRPQDQTQPPSSTATPSVLIMIVDIGRYKLEMMDKDNAIASISTPQAETPPPINTAMPSIPNTIADIMIHNDNAMPSITTAQAQPQPPIHTAMPLADNCWDRLKMTHEDNVTASINASQAQSPQINTVMPSVSKALPDMGGDSTEMTHEDNAMDNISASQTQTPPVYTEMPFVPNMVADTDWNNLNIIREENTVPSTNSTQAKATQPSGTAMSSVSKTTGSNNEYVTRCMSEVSPNSETAGATPIAREKGPILKVYKRRARPLK